MSVMSSLFKRLLSFSSLEKLNFIAWIKLLSLILLHINDYNWIVHILYQKKQLWIVWKEEISRRDKATLIFAWFSEPCLIFCCIAFIKTLKLNNGESFKELLIMTNKFRILLHKPSAYQFLLYTKNVLELRLGPL